MNKSTLIDLIIKYLDNNYIKFDYRDIVKEIYLKDLDILIIPKHEDCIEIFNDVGSITGIYTIVGFIQHFMRDYEIEENEEL